MTVMNWKKAIAFAVLTCTLAVPGCAPANDAQKHYNQMELTDETNLAEFQSKLPPGLPSKTIWSGKPEDDRNLYYLFPDKSEMIVVCKPKGTPDNPQGLEIRRVDFKGSGQGSEDSYHQSFDLG